jgi:protein TonB
MANVTSIAVLFLALIPCAIAGEKETRPATPALPGNKASPAKPGPMPYFPHRTDVALDAFKDPSHQPPRAIVQTPPKVPLGVHGKLSLTVAFIIEVDGAVRDAVVTATSGSAELDQAAVETVRRWKFTPAKVGGKPVATVSVQPMNFDLR